MTTRAMTPERWQRVQDVFAAVLERPPAARGSYLQEISAGDSELLKEVESLLDSHEKASSTFLNAPPISELTPGGSGKASMRSLPAAMRLGHYEILSPLGAGGMGQVYRARDTKLRRDVAIKVLPPALAEDADALARFEREALAVAALSHPNILSIFDFGTQNGTTFAVMELLEGETLRDKLSAGSISRKQAVDYALQIARGLSAAHESGVVHRDLKPENIFVTRDAHVKILDFGLAKRVGTVKPGEETSAPTDANYTEPGIVMGTVGYMSPEQVRGLAVDHRSDIFAFGAVLYELLSGQRAFKRDTAADTMAAILKEQPPDLSSGAHRVPPALDRVLRRCLEKDKALRFHSAQDIAFALADTASAPVGELGPAVAAEDSTRRPLLRSPWLWASLAAALAAAGGAALWLQPGNSSIASLAVLPFANAESDQSLDYLNDGLTDALVTSLSRLPNLRVMSRDSVAGFKKRDVSARDAGRELKVQAVLKGRFSKRDQDLAITAELVDVRDGTHLWGGRFDRKLSDMQAVEAEIATQVSEKLRARLSGAEKTLITKRETDSPEAYQFYLKGRYFFEKRTEEQIKKSIEYFTQAIDLDPGYALAYAGLSSAYAVCPSYSFLSPQDSFPKSRAAAARALEIDDSIAQAHANLGWVLWANDWNYPGAEQEFQRAIDLNPNESTARGWYALFLVSQGRADEAVTQFRRAIEIDPFSRSFQMNLARGYLFARQYDRAIEEARKAPDFPLSHSRIADAYVAKGMRRQAAEEYRKAAALSGKNAQGIWFRGQAEALEGRREDAERTIAEMKSLSTDRYIEPDYIAQIYVLLNEKEKAFEWLEKSIQDHSFLLVFLRVAPVWDPLRQDPRFESFLKKLNLIA